MYSDYYEREVSEAEIREAVNSYLDWMDRHNLVPDARRLEDVLLDETGSTLTTVLYHAEINQQEIVKELDKAIEIALPWLSDANEDIAMRLSKAWDRFAHFPAFRQAMRGY